MIIREVATKVYDFLDSHKTLARMLAAFVVGFVLGALVF